VSWNRALVHLTGGCELGTDVMRGTRGWYQGYFVEASKEGRIVCVCRSREYTRIRGIRVRIDGSIDE